MAVLSPHTVFAPGRKPPKAEIIQLLEQIAGGTAGIGDYQGEWNIATQYYAKDYVQDGGNIWYAKRDNIGVSPVEGDDWTLLLPGATPADDTITWAKLDPDLRGVIRWDFETVADLLADTGLSYTTGNMIVAEGDVVAAGGYRYTVAASGATLIASANLSGYHVITAGGVKLKVVKVDNHHNVKAFGAKGDNATADHGPIQRAIWALGAYGGRIIFPTGNYRINQRLLPTPNCAGLELVGEGFRGCALVWDGNAGGSNRIIIHLTDDLDNCLIEGLILENLGDAQIGILIECVRVTMRRLFANPTVKFATHIIATSTTLTTYNVTMDDVHLFSSVLGQEHDVAVNIARGHTFNARGCLFSGHKIALRLGNSTTLVGANIDGCRFETFSGIDAGYPGATNATGLQLGEVWGASITGCNFEMASDQNAAGGAHRGIRMGNVKGVSVRGNAFQGQGVALSGIDLSDANAGGVMIDGNAFYRLASADRVSVSGTGSLSSAVISGNPLFS